MSVAFWVTAVISLLSAGVSFAFSVAAARRGAGAARTSALYTLARSGAILVVAVGSLFVHSLGVVAAVAGIMIVTQAADAVIGVVTRNRAATVGPIVFAVMNAAALVWLLAIKLH
ncbi:MAG: hypothetical protein M3N46_11185 [Actinomycetota bacterium]|nr:hypothetical protein [Actinomycetota bacterium]